jgi:ParB family chromosome partitioning protein
LVKPEHRKLLEKLLGSEDGKPVKLKRKNALPESLRRDLAEDRLQAAKVEIAKHPAIALDLLAFQAASEFLGTEKLSDGPKVEFKLPKPGNEREPSVAERAFAAIEKSLPTGWLKAKNEAARFEAFCALPLESKLGLLAYCVSVTLQPKLAPDAEEERTAYDAALSKTGGRVADYWRPTKANFLGRVSRD